MGSVLLYVTSTVMLIYFSLNYNSSLQELNYTTWSILFWLTVLFSAVNAVSNSFYKESSGRFFYYYYICPPQAFIHAKLLYNFFFTALLSLLTFCLFMIVMNVEILQLKLYLLSLLLGSGCISLLFTLMGAIASRVGNNSTLVAVLGFPIIIPILIFITKLSAAAMDSQAEDPMKNILLLSAFLIIQFVLAHILFPYIWRD